MHAGDAQWAQIGPNLCVDDSNIPGAVHPKELALRAIVVEESNGISEEDVQAVLDLLLGVIGTLHQRAAIVVADAGVARRMGLDVPHMALGAADIAAGEAVKQ